MLKRILTCPIAKKTVDVEENLNMSHCKNNKFIINKARRKCPFYQTIQLFIYKGGGQCIFLPPAGQL